MINAPSTTFVPSVERVRPIHRLRLGQNSFWLLFAIEALVLVIAVAALVRAMPSSIPAAAAPDYTTVREAVLQRANGSVVDPLIEVTPGRFGPASNVRGLELNNVTYYYYFEGMDNFDPLSRNRVNPERVRVVLRDEVMPHPLVIYTLAP